MTHDDLHPHSRTDEPFAFIAVEPAPACFDCPAPWRDRIMIDASHDGAVIPPEFLEGADGQVIDAARYQDAFVRERDWGANLVAARVASALGLGGYYRVNIARVLLDFGRFPGLTKQDHGHLRRFAINYPFSELLDWRQIRRLLDHYYDRISAAIDVVVRDRLVKIAIHTYDRYNPSGTERPLVSLVTRAFNYQSESRMPYGVFDELTPDGLGETTSHTLLRDRLALTLEKADIPVEHNYPYQLPEGAIEVRSQVWFFFNYLRRHFEEAHPQTADDPAYRWVWTMLLDTNLRSSESEALRSYLHMFRRVPTERLDEFRAARRAYAHVQSFLEDDRGRVVEEYDFAGERPSSMAIEVRKDLVFDFDDAGQPVAPRTESIARIGDAIAKGLSLYLTNDRGGL